MVANGIRREFALKTCDFEEACRKAADMDAVWEAPNKEVAIAQITAMKGFSKQAMNLPHFGIDIDLNFYRVENCPRFNWSPGDHIRYICKLQSVL